MMLRIIITNLWLVIKTSVERQVELQLRDHDVRFTSGRRAVVAELARAEGPLAAAELHEALHRKVPLSSIYRSLSVLEHADVVTPHLGAKGLTRFELSEWLTGHHHHLVCIDCGSVSDVELSEQREASVLSLVSEISESASFRPIDHALEIEGRCARCA